MTEGIEAIDPLRKETLKGEKKNPWLSAYHNSVAGISAYTSCMQLVDVYGDGDMKLVVASADKRLKLYKGSSLYGEQALLGIPTCLSVFHSDLNRPRIPSIAIACGTFIYIYKNFRPFYKFSIPAVDINPDEANVWASLIICTIEIPDAVKRLYTLRENGGQITERSRGLLSLDSIEEQADYVSRFMDEPLIDRACVTCMTSIKKDMDDFDALSNLVVATEAQIIYILDTQGTAILKQINVHAVPVDVLSSGLLDVESRIIFTTRNGSIHTIKNNELLKTAIDVESPPCNLLVSDKSIIVATTNRKLASYHFKGKRNWTLSFDSDIVAIEIFSLRRTKDTKGIFVALRSGDIFLYNQKIKVCSLKVDGVITGMLFGQYGREESSLVLVQKSGALSLKILKRTANLEAIAEVTGPPPEQDIPLDIPKKTKLYVEQTQRERDHAIDMHRHFQRDLCKLRLTTARAYVKTINDTQMPVSFAAPAALRLNVQVQGIGPTFRIKLNIHNGGTKTISDLNVVCHYDHTMYQIPQSIIPLPLVIPGIQYQYATTAIAISETGAADNIYIFVCSTDNYIPLVSAIVSMPLSESLML